ncbi:hypothetical protein GCM10009839_71350 [Catenulispora yoronensis]|uniref:Dystroglycan-type cadherin-like domain-containing protein n=1 Tax=Catenulispora yoronensis TaxID=450799 RepID=A0ABN2V6B4_9ACTN
MLKRTAALLAATAVTVAVALTASAASAGPAGTTGTATSSTAGHAPAAAPLAAVTLANTIALDDCSASLVRYPSSQSSDRALMLTAGHCWEGGEPSAGQVLQNVNSSRTGTLLNSSGGSLGTVQADKLLYATMTNTDIAIYELTKTFAAISSQYGATPMTISASHPTSAEAISIPSAYWKRIWACNLNGFAGTVREDQWTWHDSLRYDMNGGCEVIGGSSGSPVVDTGTGAVIGVNNTINEDGQVCTLNNPCEVNSNGTTTATKGQGYGQELYWVTTCLNSSRAIDLTLPGCLLSNPNAGNTVTVTNPGNQSVAVNTAVNLQITGHDSDSSQTLTYTATGLPAGLSISSSGLISGTATTAGTSTVTVTAKDSTNASGNTSFTFTVTGTSGGGITNGGFETNGLSGWTTTVGSATATTSGPHSGTSAAMVGSVNPSGTSSIAQTFTAATGSTTLAFWYNVTCPDTVAYDWATVTLKDNTSGTTSTVLAKTCTLGAGWKQVTKAVTAGHSYTLTLTSKDDNYPGDPTYTLYDDVTVS